MQNLAIKKRNAHDSRSYRRTQMQKEFIIQKLREQGCRITKQRLMLLDIILEEECSSCKEIYYKAFKKEERIGSATVYRMINTLEDIGAISRNSMYRIACSEECEECGDCGLDTACTIELDDGTVIELTAKDWNTVIQKGLRGCGYIEEQNLRNVVAKACRCENE